MKRYFHPTGINSLKPSFWHNASKKAVLSLSRLSDEYFLAKAKEKPLIALSVRPRAF